MYLNQYWKDERLAFSSEENKVLTLSGDFAEKIWVPDTFFANDKKRWSQHQSAELRLSEFVTLVSCTTWQSRTRWSGSTGTEPSPTGWGSPPRWPVWWTSTTTRWTDKTALWRLRAVSVCKCLAVICKGIFADGYTISDVVMYWRDEPVVGVEVRLTVDWR